MRVFFYGSGHSFVRTPNANTTTLANPVGIKPYFLTG